jgi:hypothetical protein
LVYTKAGVMKVTLKKIVYLFLQLQYMCDCLNIRFAIQLFNLVWYTHVLLLTQNADAYYSLTRAFALLSFFVGSS